MWLMWSEAAAARPRGDTADRDPAQSWLTEPLAVSVPERTSVPSGLFRVNPVQDAALAGIGWKIRTVWFPVSQREE